MWVYTISAYRAKHSIFIDGRVVGIDSHPLGGLRTAYVAFTRRAKSGPQDKIFCLCCGKGFKVLKRHILTSHNLSAAEYRARFRLSGDYPLVAESYSEMKSKHLKKVNFSNQ